jgi:hypothetical protein
MISLHSNTSSSSTSQKIALNPVIRIFIVVCWSVRRFPHAGFEQWYIFSSWLDLFLDFDFPWVKLETGWSKMTGQTNLHYEWPLRLTDLDLSSFLVTLIHSRISFFETRENSTFTQKMRK